MLDGDKYFRSFPNESAESDSAASGTASPRRLMSAALRTALDALEIEYRNILQAQSLDQDDQSD